MCKNRLNAIILIAGNKKEISSEGRVLRQEDKKIGKVFIQLCNNEEKCNKNLSNKLKYLNFLFKKIWFANFYYRTITFFFVVPVEK